MRYHCTLNQLGKFKKSENTMCWVRKLSKFRNSQIVLLGVQIGTNHFEKASGHCLLKLNMCISYDPAVLPLSTSPRETLTYLHPDTYTRMFLAVFSSTNPNWNFGNNSVHQQ